MSHNRAATDESPSSYTTTWVSGPMPSREAPQSSTASRPALLVGSDPVLEAQGPSDLVEPVEQHLPPVGLHGKRGAEPQAVVHALLFEVDGELILAAGRLRAAEQLGDLLGQEIAELFRRHQAAGGEYQLTV